VGFGFLLFGAIDLDRPDAAPWETLIERLVGAVGPDADPGTAAGDTDSPG
jgi:hypothetical protein